MDTELKKVISSDTQDFTGKKTKPVPNKKPAIGIDTESKFYNNIVNTYDASVLDLTAFDSFFSATQSRNQIYDLIDAMSQDPILASVLSTYAEDATEYNDQGKIVWVESSDDNVAKYVNFLLNSIDVDKHIYEWVYNLCKYGDLYIKLYRQSEYDDDLFEINSDEDESQDKNDNKALNEDVKLNVFSKKDKLTHYVEMMEDPSEMFELTKFGKTYGYIKAPNSQNTQQMQGQFGKTAPVFSYYFKKNDIEVFDATSFVHACLISDTSREVEQVNITTDDNEKELTYKVRKGQSLFLSVMKVWRELNLLEQSILLNRVTKSSIVRILNVEVGDMPKESVGPHLAGIKSMIEQKAALNSGKSMNEYTNPGPVENNIYVPTRGGIGSISPQEIGGDVDVKGLADLDYFKNKFYGALRIPKQYFGDTEDGAGFNGGQSLSIISSRYAKMVKRIQSVVTQCITDIINLMLLDKGMNSFINNFAIHMLPPTTQEEIDRRDAMSSKIDIISNIMNVLDSIEDEVTKLKIIKSLLANAITDVEVITLVQDEIEKIEKAKEEETSGDMEELGSGDESEFGGGMPSMGASSGHNPQDSGSEEIGGEELGVESDEGTELSGESNENEDVMLPTPADLGKDFTK